MDHGVPQSSAVLLLGVIGVGRTAGRFFLDGLADRMPTCTFGDVCGHGAPLAVWAVSARTIIAAGIMASMGATKMNGVGISVRPLQREHHSTSLPLWRLSALSIEPAMRAPKTVRSAEALGRVRLSRSFFMRDFLYSEIAMFTASPTCLTIQTLRLPPEGACARICWSRFRRPLVVSQSVRLIVHRS